MLTEQGYVHDLDSNIRFIGDVSGKVYTITKVTTEEGSDYTEYVAVERGFSDDEHTVYFSSKSNFVHVTY